ncbi:uncharacterized protein LOC123220010 [Mangifera indica]|uniref:uncharacterized protein LOC123220010 n=1 Tax=Mangifera indica TaxID=29780 RepID=UPI001CF99169|nr:uncharacterized protein LOC123220010 [Mangifera indica]
MERKVLVVCCFVGFLGLLSAATGFGAEATRIKGSEVHVTGSSQCSYPRSPALGLGLTAVASLLIAQITISVATGCFCCRQSPDLTQSNWKIALVCFVVSWITFVIAFLLLLTGAALNDQNGEEGLYFGSYYCYVVKPGVFAGGAVLALATVALGILYYLNLNSVKNNNSNQWSNTSGPHDGGIAMGQPQFPPPTCEDPVFVHEDTYMRRQQYT